MNNVLNSVITQLPNKEVNTQETQSDLSQRIYTNSIKTLFLVKKD